MLVDSIKEFRAVWNGSLLASRAQHFCANRDCCKHFDEAYTVRRMASAYTRLMMRSAPVVPVRSKWTKVGETPDVRRRVPRLTSVFGL